MAGGGTATPASTPAAARSRPAPRSTSFFRGPVRHTLPAAAATAVACLFVSVTAPQTASAAAGVLPAASAASGTQHFTADGSTGPTAGRDDFSVGRTAAALRVPGGSGPTGGAVRPTVGAVPDEGGFGSRWVVGCAACSSNHQGVDFAAAIGTPVVAALPGRVVSAGVLGGYGNQVLLQHADGTETRYGHLSVIDVRPGQVVAVGERLGAVGDTGVSTGAHLHFEVIVAGTPIDPASWLQARGLL
ncbi:M23 family metallopeptidase [Curtobacterium aurantiacum]|uniref:M23 family metallopeptidase n=1 Tax=Curtobacterium aurantiacum TaxID=3236919 RepID=UPI001BDE6EFA|nr:M23 family metallopeptidase [Curtobacterium flaccumfaciens]MBT1678876.1 M23 family metallopeptidase [Curtobacterium flaccumfaciens pv. flaccumfaciens]